MSLEKRVTKAQAALNFVNVLQRDRRARVVSVLVPGSKAKTYHVILRRNPVLSCEINIYTPFGLVKPKYARTVITYHAMAAVMLAAKENGFSVSWCANEDDAKNLSNLGGTSFILYNHDNNHVKMYGVYHD